ncbi:MAG TPA: FAD-dependent oxidoreductase, partial [Gammaproteobacteria bacterium]|nr:FAD-dependent oxidoreductase [Gammaproteobacteria bacterium]
GFDGLKIEPLPERLLKEPIYRFADLKENLDERIMAGFGGVAEYGITVRWDKNFLKLIYLTLLRRPTFQVFGSVRFGGTLKVEDAWELGFDHLAVAVGAGLPKTLSIPGSLAPGMRQANDFLMALQLGNAAKKNSLSNLQIRLPAVVIGGGLTAVDTATEVQAYYITQVEKVLARYEELARFYGEEKIQGELDLASQEILEEHLNHGRSVREEREAAKREGRTANFIKLFQRWGGVTIVYRRSMQESPAYINNHEELQKAFEEGIYYREGLEPVAVELNAAGHTEALLCRPRSRTSVDSAHENKEGGNSTEELRYLLVLFLLLPEPSLILPMNSNIAAPSPVLAYIISTMKMKREN